VAVVLFTVGALFSVYEGVERIRSPEQVSSPYVAFGVLFIAIALEGFSLRTAITESRQARGSASWRSFVMFIRRAKAPELPAVVLEDTAALTGLVFALAGVSLTEATGDSRWDGAGSIAIGALLACVAAVLAIEMKSLLIGESASPDVEAEIVAAIEDGPEVLGVIHLRTLHVGPDTLLVAAKIAVAGGDPAARIVAGIDAAERRVRATVPIAQHIFLEPGSTWPTRPCAPPAVRRPCWPGAAAARCAPAASYRARPWPASWRGNRHNPGPSNGVITGAIGPSGLSQHRLSQHRLSLQGDI
jgi:divalent metal cation (Fe/Co/Zn/Cd) transporter